MFLDAEEIENYASRFVEIPERRLFPMNGEVFARFVRERPVSPEVSDSDGWVFGGYGICQGYELNEEAKPLGRSLWWRYLDINTFPPQKVCFRLQPPQVVSGIFTLQGGSHQMKIQKIETILKTAAEKGQEETKPESSEDPEGKIIPFRPKS